MRGDNGWIQVSVPEALVADVYSLIGNRLGERADSAPEPKAEGAREDSEAVWTPELMRRCYRESPKDSMRPILDCLADQASEWLRTSELMSATKYRARAQMAGVFGAFGRRVKNRYGMASWPMEVRWNHEHNEAEYRLPSELAEILERESQQASVAGGGGHS